jgi:RNA polymerase sigma-70 factor (ECF subfamily)
MNRSPRIRLVLPEERPPATAPLRFDEVFKSYARYVGAIGLRTLGRPDEVDDFVQDVFMHVHRGLHKVVTPAAIKGWLAAIAVRLALRRLRRRRLLRLVGLDEAPSYEAVADPGLSPEDRALLAQLYRRLDTIPPRHRLAWTLRQVEGEPLEQVAVLCGCSLATAKRWIESTQEALRGSVPNGPREGR